MPETSASYPFFESLRNDPRLHALSMPVIVADDLRTPENMGAVLRLAGNMGACRTVFISERAAAFRNFKISKTASGAQDKVKWAISSQTRLRELVPADYHIIALETSEKSDSLFTHHLPEKCAFVVGNEVKGIRQEILQQTDSQRYIPIPGPISSLNVTHALAIALFEWWRQRRIGDR